MELCIDCPIAEISPKAKKKKDKKKRKSRRSSRRKDDIDDNTFMSNDSFT